MKEDIIRERPTKYILRYGKRLKEIAPIFGVSLSTIHHWLQNPVKKQWMEQKLEDFKKKGVNNAKRGI